MGKSKKIKWVKPFGYTPTSDSRIFWSGWIKAARRPEIIAHFMAFDEEEGRRDIKSKIKENNTYRVVTKVIIPSSLDVENEAKEKEREALKTMQEMVSYYEEYGKWPPNEIEKGVHVIEMKHMSAEQLFSFVSPFIEKAGFKWTVTGTLLKIQHEE